MSKRKAAAISQDISKFFPPNKVKNSEYQQNIGNIVTQRPEAILNAENSCNDPNMDINKIKTERDEYRNENELLKKQIKDLKTQAIELKKQVEKYKACIQTKDLYASIGLDDVSIIGLNTIDSSKKDDRKFIRNSLKALYIKETSKLSTRSLKGAQTSSQAITPEKLSNMKKMFWNRVQSSTENESERNSRYNQLDSHISRILTEFKEIKS